MVSQPELIEVIVEKLKQYQPKNIVVDPVMVSTSGDRLLAQKALTMLQKELLPLAQIITPNIPEAEVLCEFSIESKDDMVKAAQKIATKLSWLYFD